MEIELSVQMYKLHQHVLTERYLQHDDQHVAVQLHLRHHVLLQTDKLFHMVDH